MGVIKKKPHDATLAEGIISLVEAVREDGVRRHNLRDTVQTTIEKVSILEKEVEWMKRTIHSIAGDGTGATGMLPDLQKGQQKTQIDITEVKGDMRDVKRDMEGVLSTLKDIKEGQQSSQSFMDKWGGVGVAIGILTAIGAVLVEYFKH